MARGFVGISVKGFEKVLSKLTSIPKELTDAIDAEFAAGANLMVNKAVADAPEDQGVVRNEITAKRERKMKWAVVSGAEWSAFIEFGTKSRAKVPSELQSVAAQFKGKRTGSGKGFFDSILAWVKRKGITGTYNVKTRRREGSKVDKQIEDEQVAFAIYLSILRHGVHPHPFFYKNFYAVQPQVEKNIEAVFKRVING